MIILDIETGGLDPRKNALLSIGAVDYEVGDEFYIECRAWSELALDATALAINGFTVAQAMDESKPFADVAYCQFLRWCQGRPGLIGGQQVGSFDLRFLRAIHDSALATVEEGNTAYVHYGKIKDIGQWPFGHRSVDLHSVAFSKLGKSLSLDGILIAVGLQPEPKPHNALTGARLERDAFKRLLS
jgi:DNA polymerase III epsilon subunit-like protein